MTKFDFINFSFKAYAYITYTPCIQEFNKQKSYSRNL